MPSPSRKRAYHPTERDIAIVRRVHSHRLLRSRDHLVRLFGGSENILRRIQLLTKHKYLYTLKRRQHEQAIYGLGNRGSDLLLERFGIPRPKVDWSAQNRDLKPRHIEHTLLIADIVVSVELACRQRRDIEYIPPEEILDGAPQITRSKQMKVGENPLSMRTRVWYRNEWSMRGLTSDWLFGLRFPNTDDEVYFFLEADRGTMSVVAQNLSKASIIKKQLVYYHAWKKDRETRSSLYEKLFGIPDIRTLFVVDTGFSSTKRLQSFIEASKLITDGRGTGLFLFVTKASLLNTDNILNVPLLNGRGEIVRLID